MMHNISTYIAVVWAAVQMVVVSGTTADVRLTPRVAEDFVSPSPSTMVTRARIPACEPYSILASRSGSIDMRTITNADVSCVRLRVTISSLPGASLFTAQRRASNRRFSCSLPEETQRSAFLRSTLPTSTRRRSTFTSE